jgi:Ti-type conjugative transfer relaxase TraA
MGEGRDPTTHQLRPAAANDDAARVAWISSQGFGAWTAQDRADIETMRKVMEHAAFHQTSKTKLCRDDCLHLVLSWKPEENPSRAQMEQAAQEAMKALGMENARAIFAAHRDTNYQHLHIVASRINPETGRVFDNWQSKKKLQAWAHEWEQRHGLVVCHAREKRSQLRIAIEERNAANVRELITQRQATFTGKEVDRHLKKYIGDTGEAAAFRAAILAQADVLRLYDRETGKQLDRFTTRAVRDAETKAVRHAAALAADQRHQVGKKAARAALAQCPTMRDEQRRAFDHATRGAGIAIIDGKAGTGKSYTMRAIRMAYEGDGKRVLGLAPTNAVAQDMERDGFTAARTIHRALFDLKTERDRWDKKTVVMVDEAAMIGTTIMGELLTCARDAGAKVILVGDDRQLGSIECGGLFGELRECLGAVELSDVTRQRDPHHRAIAEMLARGEFGEAVDALDKLGCITRSNHQSESVTALVEQWAKDTEAAPHLKRFVFAYTNDDVAQLNAELRDVLKKRGELGNDYAFKTKYGKANFAEGDRLIFRATDKRQGITNGETGTVERIEDEFITLRMDSDRTREFTFNADKFDSFAHGYAGTIHKGQGRTFDDVYLYHSQHWKDSAAYVALTRHRDDVKLFVSNEVTEDNAELARQLARHDENRASLAFATKEEAQEQRIEQHQRAAEEVTGHKAAPFHEPPPHAPEPPPAPTHEPERPASTTEAKHTPPAAIYGEDSRTPDAETKAAELPQPKRPEERKAEEARAVREAAEAKAKEAEQERQRAEAAKPKAQEAKPAPERQQPPPPAPTPKPTPAPEAIKKEPERQREPTPTATKDPIRATATPAQQEPKAAPERQQPPPVAARPETRTTAQFAAANALKSLEDYGQRKAHRDNAEQFGRQALKPPPAPTPSAAKAPTPTPSIPKPVGGQPAQTTAPGVTTVKPVAGALRVAGGSVLKALSGFLDFFAPPPPPTPSQVVAADKKADERAKAAREAAELETRIKAQRDRENQETCERERANEQDNSRKRHF